MDAKECRAGSDRENHAIDHLVCALRISGIARHQFRDSGLWQRVSESASRGGVLRQPAEQSADGILFAGDDREGRASAWNPKMRPVCVMRSEWRCTVVSDDSVRLGFCVVKVCARNMRKNSLGNVRKQAFQSIEDFKRRVRMTKEELRTLAELGALNCFSEHRRAAMWEVEKQMPERYLLIDSGEAKRSRGISRIFVRSLAPLGMTAQSSPLCR